MAQSSSSERERGPSGQDEPGGRASDSWLMPPPAPEDAITLLEQGNISEPQLIPSGSNYTFSVFVSNDGRGEFPAIYKPQRGERPLWDFPEGTLYRRERAAYLLSCFLGWPKIPPTVIREGPLGIGSLQLYVPTEDEWDFDDLRRKNRRELMEIALFDLVANNADRKAGHCLMGLDRQVWAIDHGLTFNTAPKLRTVLWDYCGDTIPQKLLGELEALRDSDSRRQELAELLGEVLAQGEIEALFRRIERVLRVRKYPQLDPNHNIPWPLV